jgi:ketosteroid isomerase-like protein
MNTQQNIRKQLDQWSKAEQAADTAKLHELLADEFLGVGPKGFVLNKQQWAGRFQGGFSYESIELEETQMKLYEKAVVVVAKQSQKASFNGQRSDGIFRMSQTWIQNEGSSQWQLALLQLSIIDANIPSPRS